MSGPERRPEDFRSWVDGTYDTAAARIAATVAEATGVEHAADDRAAPSSNDSGLPPYVGTSVPVRGGGGRRTSRRLVGATVAAVLVVGVGLGVGVFVVRSDDAPDPLAALVAAPLAADAVTPPSIVDVRYVGPLGATAISEVTIDADGTSASGQTDGVMPEGDGSGTNVLTSGGYTTQEAAGLPTDAETLTSLIADRVRAPVDSPRTAGALALFTTFEQIRPLVRSAALGALVTVSDESVEQVSPPDTAVVNGIQLSGTGWTAWFDQASGALQLFGWASTTDGPIDSWLSVTPRPFA